MDISESMKKEYIRNGIIASVIGVGVLTGMSFTGESEEIPEQTHSYDDQLSKYGDNIVRGDFNFNLAEEFIHNGKLKAFKESQTAKLKKVIKLEKEQKERERLALIEKKKQQELKRKKEQANHQVRSNQVVKTKDTSGGNWMTIEASYYTAKCNGCTGITKTEVDVRNTTAYQGMRIIATDPRVIPLWSILEIKTKTGSYKAISLDTGGYIKGNKMDVLVSSTKEALKLGRHNVQVKIIRKGK